MNIFRLLKSMKALGTICAIKCILYLPHDKLSAKDKCIIKDWLPKVIKIGNDITITAYLPMFDNGNMYYVLDDTIYKNGEPKFDSIITSKITLFDVMHDVVYFAWGERLMSYDIEKSSLITILEDREKASLIRSRDNKLYIERGFSTMRSPRTEYRAERILTEIGTNRTIRYPIPKDRGLWKMHINDVYNDKVAIMHLGGPSELFTHTGEKMIFEVVNLLEAYLRIGDITINIDIRNLMYYMQHGLFNIMLDKDRLYIRLHDHGPTRAITIDLFGFCL